MRIPCPFCGPRDSSEFSYLGDATVQRPDSHEADVDVAMFEYVYPRANPAGSHDELWYHAGGCHSWLRLTRNTRSHDISGASFAAKDAHNA